jgi:hypothetical protein
MFARSGNGIAFALFALCFAVPLRLPAVAFDGGDDFNDNAKNSAKWGADYITGSGTLSETNQRLEFVVVSPSQEDESDRPWIASLAPKTNDWEIVLDVHNAASPAATNQVASFGIEVVSASDYSKVIYMEIYASTLYMLPLRLRRGFKTALLSYTSELAYADSTDIGVINGAVRLLYSPDSAVITAYGDINGSADGYTWTKLGSFGVHGSGGETGNATWDLSANEPFAVAVYGFAANVSLSSGAMYGDNFAALGMSTVQPSLNITGPGSPFQLSWPHSALGFRLEESTNLKSAAWSSVTNAPTVQGNVDVLLVVPRQPAQFYRLAYP